jgi:hypothetical protein
MKKNCILIIFFAFYWIPTVVWAGFSSRDPVAKALDEYENGRDVARQQLTAKAEQPAEKEGVDPEQVVKKANGTGPQRKTFETEIGSETYNYEYLETVEGAQFMKLKGQFYGVFLKLTFRPNQLDPIYSEMFDFFRFETRYAWAKLDYYGGVNFFDMFGNKVGSVPLETANNPDIVSETRILIGKDLPWRGYSFTPYSGIGFRYLVDDSSDIVSTVEFEGTTYDVGGYMRKSYYYYVPIGVDIKRPLSSSWQIGLNAEFDYVVYALQKSYIETYNNQVIQNKQPQGYGLRSSLRLERNSPNWGFQVEPFVRFWDIQRSAFAATGPCFPDGSCFGGEEPSNTTREVGVRLGLTF